MVIDKVGQTLDEFCIEFVKNPYLCYTEHGLHARYWHCLFSRLSEEEKYGSWDGEKVCMVQKEYPTSHNLDKSKRQHWDIAILRNPLEASSKPDYDHLRIDAAVEFGLNAGEKHLREDVRRLSHSSSNVDSGFAAHFYRISRSRSGRDKNPKSRVIWPKDDIGELERLASDSRVTVYYALVDSTGSFRKRAIRIDDEGVHDLISAT